MFDVHFRRRLANVVAHSFTRAARSYANPTLFDVVPSCIQRFLLNNI